MSLKTVQTLLAAAGFDPGSLDGVWGPRTRGALEAALAAARAATGAGEDDPETSLLMAELVRDEGFVPHAYRDSLGYWTIGIGRLIDQRKGGGVSRAEAEMLKRNDIAKARAGLDAAAPWWRGLDPVRQRVMLNMTFNMGPGWVADFRNTSERIRLGDYAGAARGMQASLWARQTGERARRLAAMMRDGVA